MNRKLLILDIVLGAGAIYGGFQLHDQWVAAKVRQAEAAHNPVKPAPPPPVAPLPEEHAVIPSGYKGIVDKTLFEPSRNPDVPVDIPPPPPPPPSPPPLPNFHGMMDLGDAEGPIALMTAAGEERQQGVHRGEKIGPFKLLAFNRQEITLDWEGRIIHKRVDEAAEGSGAKSAPRGKGEPIVGNGIIPGQAAPKQAAPAAQSNANLGPGPVLTDTVRACQAFDGTPPGSVVDGYRKELRPSPMGTPQCLWTAVGK